MNGKKEKIYAAYVSNIIYAKKYRKVRDHCYYTAEYRGTAHSICNLKYSPPIKIPIVFHNGCSYNYHFIIKELSEEFKKQFTCLGENTEKYITFTVPIKNKLQELKKNGEEVTKTIWYVLQIIDSARFMASSLSNLVNNLSDGFHKM